MSQAALSTRARRLPRRRPEQGVVVSPLGVGADPGLGLVVSTCPRSWPSPSPRRHGWPLAWVVGALSLGLLVSGLVSPRVGRAIERSGGRIVLAASAVLIGAGLACLGLEKGAVPS